jgi:hypothetical protein
MTTFSHSTIAALRPPEAAHFEAGRDNGAHHASRPGDAVCLERATDALHCVRMDPEPFSGEDLSWTEAIMTAEQPGKIGLWREFQLLRPILLRWRGIEWATTCVPCKNCTANPSIRLEKNARTLDLRSNLLEHFRA